MKKEVIVTLSKSVGNAIIGVIGFAIAGGGLYTTINALDKRFNRRLLARAAKLAFENDLKEGEIQEIYRSDAGVRFIQKEFLIDVAMFIVDKIKYNGQYKMRYIGSRSYTKKEAKFAIDL